MKISIITATFNSAANIAGCIGSINEQTHPDIEHIIIDAASKDNTLEIIKSLPNRVTKIISEPDKGIYDALNKGIQLSTGDVIGFLHSDDLLANKHIIEKIVLAFHSPQTLKIPYHFSQKEEYNSRLRKVRWMEPKESSMEDVLSIERVSFEKYNNELKLINQKRIELEQFNNNLSFLLSGGILQKLNKSFRNVAEGDNKWRWQKVRGGYHNLIANDAEKIDSFPSGEEGRGKISGVYGNLLFTDTKNTDKVVRCWESKPFNYKNLKNGWTPPHPTLFLRKEVYQKYGLFNTSFKIAGDYDFVLRVLQDKEYNMVHLPEVITKMRVGGISTGNLNQLILKSKEDIQALRNNGFRFPLAVLAAKILRKIPQLFKR